MFATGVTVLTTRVGEQVHGMTANAFMSVSLRPPLVLISIDRRAKMGAMLHEGTRFGVSVLEAKQTGLSDRFAGRVADDLPEATFEVVHETPLVEGALAHLVARVVRSYWGGDHSLFLGQVEFARYGRAGRCSSTAGATSGSSRIRASSRCFRASCSTRSSRSARSASTPTASRSCRSARRGASFCSSSKGRRSVERPGLSLTLGPGELIGEIEVLDPGGGRIADIHAVGSVRTIAVSREQLLAALEADPRAAVALIEVLAARFRETA